jgi:hypothetical protein
VVVSNYGANTVGVFLGKGDGTFQPQASYSLNGFANNLAIADINGDGKLDIAGSYYVPVGSASTSAIGMLYGNGDGTFGSETDFNTGQAHGTFVIATDLNGDGTPDFVNVDGSYGDASSQTIATLLNITQATASKLNVTVFGPGKTQQQVIASYAGDTHYANSSSSLSVASYGTRQTPAISWTPVPAWGIGVPLGTQVLNATVTTVIPGAFSYTAQLGSPAPVAVTQTTTLTTGGSYIFNATFTPTDTNSYNTATAISTVSIVPVDFNLLTSASTITIPVGKTGTLTANVAGLYGFSGQVAITTSGTLPGGLTVTASPSAIGPGGISTITIQAPSLPATTGKLERKPNWTAWGAGGIAVAGLLWLPLMGSQRRPRIGRLVALTLFGAALTGLSGCGAHYSYYSVIRLSSSSSTVASGSPVTLTAQLSGGHSDFSGTVTFYDAGTALGSPVSINGTVATLPVSSLPVGLDELTATYSGDDLNVGASSNQFPELITGTASFQIVGTSGSITHSSSLNVTIQ